MSDSPPEGPRLIEHAFPLKQASLDSVHEKNVRHGHISTLHIWPARRPLAACRAALIATLLPDPGTPEERQELCERIGGKVVQTIERKKMPNGRTVERIKEETEGGILHWLGSEPSSGSRKKKEEYRAKAKHNEEELEWFRQQIREAYGGRAPRVLDPFAGGGAIPLEAMRLGCEVTAVDINPVAWFILKCTLEYPQKLAGKTRPLPDFILEDDEFMAAFHKAHPERTRRPSRKAKRSYARAPEIQDDLFVGTEADADGAPQADLAWHVRAWGKWVLDRARRELAPFYPTYADFEPLKSGKRYEKQPMQLVPLRDDGTADIDALNAEFTDEYLADLRNPRWVAKPTVAYLWARTVSCKNCRATIPLLKTRWLCKKASKRVLLTMKPNTDQSGVDFGIESDVPVKGSNAAQRREHDKRIGAGTMSRAGAWCPCCQNAGQVVMTMEDLRLEGRAGRLGELMTAVVVDGPTGKAYRLPTTHEIQRSSTADVTAPHIFAEIPFGWPNESLPSKEALGFRVPLYGIDQWAKVFTPNQLVSIGVFLLATRSAFETMRAAEYAEEWAEGVTLYLACMLDRLANQSSNISRWNQGGENLEGTFARFALPILWDFGEINPLGDTTGGYSSALGWVTLAVDHVTAAAIGRPEPSALRESAIQLGPDAYDCIVTDPPYYDAIPYSDLMDFFYLWLRRGLHGIDDDLDRAFELPLSPKWDHEADDGELIDDDSRHDGDRLRSKAVYEDGMARAFSRCWSALRDEGRMVTVFAHKHPDAWATLVSAMIRAGFVVDGSWPIQTERGTRTRALTGAALSSSVWLVCRKRPPAARPGWDHHVLEEMRHNIGRKLRDFWDAGIRGPDFVWSATGPALEAYSKHPVVKKANEPGKTLEVTEFLSHVRRMVVDFIVGEVLTGNGDGEGLADADRLDAPTAYYLLHRHDFAFEAAPSGACILYATACGLSDGELESSWNLLSRSGSAVRAETDDEDTDADEEADADAASDSGSKVKLKTWSQRKHKNMGYEAPGGQPVPLIDRIHRLMHLWRAGDVLKVDEYLDEHGLRRQELFKRVLQSLIELSRKDGGAQELQTLESLSNHVQAKGARPEDRQSALAFGEES